MTPGEGRTVRRRRRTPPGRGGRRRRAPATKRTGNLARNRRVLYLVSGGISLYKAIIALGTLGTLGASGFGAYHQWVSSQAAIAEVRPVIDIRIPTPVALDDDSENFTLVLSVTNTGHSRAAIKDLRIVYGHGNWLSWASLGNATLQAGASHEHRLDVPRYKPLAGAQVDLSKGADGSGAISFSVLYEGIDLEGREFEESLIVPARWVRPK